MEYKDKSIGFAPNLVPLVQNGSKTLTYRLGDKYDYLRVGDVIGVRNSDTDEVFGMVEIVEKGWTTFGELPTDRIDHEIYGSKDEQKATFKKYYGKDLSDEDKILVLGFKLR